MIYVDLVQYNLRLKIKEFFYFIGNVQIDWLNMFYGFKMLKMLF